MSGREHRAERAKWAAFTNVELRVMEICFRSPKRTRLYSQVKREQSRRKHESIFRLDGCT